MQSTNEGNTPPQDTRGKEAILRQPTQAIPVRNNLEWDAFAKEFLFPGRPVIIEDGLKNWPANGKWDLQFFRSRYESKPIVVDGRQLPMGEFLALVENSSDLRPAPYYRNICVKDVFPELLPDLAPPPPYILPNWLRGPFYPSVGREAELYIGGAGAGFPFLHYDSNSTHAFLGQLFGVKEVVLYSPSESDRVYPRTESMRRHHSRITDVERYNRQEFPLFEKALAHRGTLKPGHLLFIPCRWWHTARMLSPSITISYNVANASNWPLVRDEVCYKGRCVNSLLSFPIYIYMTLLGWGQELVDKCLG